MLEYSPCGRNGHGKITAFVDGLPVDMEETNWAKHSNRQTFANRLHEHFPGVPSEKIEIELLRAVASGKASRNGDEAKTDPPDPLESMPETVRAEARAMLEDPKLIWRIVDDVRAVGVAGELELAATVYLVGTSRLLDQPLAAIVQGPSSSGKSYVIDRTSMLFPPEAVLRATSMTSNALYYLPPGRLKHRFVVAGERSRAEDDELAEATRALREMLASGRLSKMLPIKQNGRLETVLIEQDGPIAYVESTSLSHVFEEDANRCILLTTDERPEQTQRIIRSIAAGQGASGNVDWIIPHHHALQRMLRPMQVVVPYAKRLGELFPYQRVEARRAFPHVLSAIKACALLHQCQRPVDGDGRLNATADDYQIVCHLLAKPLTRALGGGVSEPARRFHDRLLERWKASETFTTRDAYKSESVSERAVRGWLSELHRAGAIELVETAKGNRSTTWKVIAKSYDAAGSVLPELQELLT
jgi:hypothetical protein